MRKIKETFKGSPDGAHAYEYKKGKSYDRHTSPPLSESLENTADENGWLVAKSKKGKGSKKKAAAKKAAK